MNYKLLSLILLGVLLAFNFLSTYFNNKSLTRSLPNNVQDIYNLEEYMKWKAYQKERSKVDFINSIVTFIFLTTLISLNVLTIFEQINNIYLSNFVFISSFLLASSIISIPTSYLLNIKIETKYGFNKSSVKTFIGDEIKGFIVSFILVTSLSMLLILLHLSLGDFILLVLFGILLVFLLFVLFIYPLFSKIYNKFTSLSEGSLRDKLTNLLTKYGYKVNDIKVMDGSKRSKKANAYFAGLGKTKTIVLYDTIIDLLNEDELVAVFAHELAHGKYHHSKKSMIFSSFMIFLLVFAIWGTLKLPIYTSFGFNNISYGLVVVLVFSIIGQFISIPFGILTNFISRKHEYEADRFASKEGYGEYLITGLKKLAKNSFANLSPHPFIVTLFYSHPPMEKRIEAITKASSTNNN